MTRVKICGITRVEDALAAAEAGAAYVGFVLWAKSPRAATLETVRRAASHLPPQVVAVGVFVDPGADDIRAAADAGIALAQVHSSEAVALPDVGLPIVRAVHLDGDRIVPDVSDELILVDAHDPVKRGGTGTVVDWTRAARIAASRRIFLAGGLTPANVAAAIRQVTPFAVDVASGVEAAPGIKDHARIRAFIAAAHGPTGSTHGT